MRKPRKKPERLLLLACSQRKLATKGLLPALERYDGPAFRVVRKFLREQPEANVTVCIVSAKFGLVRAERRLPWYDCRLESCPAERWRRQVRRTARTLLTSRTWSAVGVCAGRAYRTELEPVLASVSGLPPVDLLGGGLGARLTALRAWLRKTDSSCEFET